MRYRIEEDLKNIREILNISQDELANNIGVDKKTITRIEKGNGAFLYVRNNHIPGI